MPKQELLDRVPGLLTLTRKEGEWVDIFLPDGTKASVAITAIKSNKVRISVDAPGCKILRRELVGQEAKPKRLGGSDADN